MECYICGSKKTNKCHVKDHCEFKARGESHYFHNIIELCQNCHYNYFDSEKIAIVPNENIFLILKSIHPLRIDCVYSKQKIHVKSEYIFWKNNNSHICLQSRLRKIEIFIKSQ